MNSLYPSNGITPPAMPPQIDFNQLLQLRESENLADLNRQTNVLKPRIEAIGSNLTQPTQQPKNIVFNPGITPFQQGTLALRDKDIETRRQLGEGKLDVSKEGLNVKREGLDVTRNLGEKKIETNRQIEEGKLTLADWKAKHPDGKIAISKGGNIVVVNPQTGEAIDTGVSSGTLSDKDKIELAGGEARKTKEVIPGRAPVNATADLPTQQKVGSQLKAQELINTHPEWGKYIKIDPNSGLVIVTPPGNGFFGASGPDKAIYDQINQALYPKSNSTPSVGLISPKVANEDTKLSTQSNVMEKVQRNSKGETRTVVSTDGGKTWVPKK